jgi:DNA-binding NarL/FixJ family response regulator
MSHQPLAPCPRSRKRVVILDPQPLSREGIRTLLAGSSEFRVVGECADARSAFVLADAREPDLVVIDPALPDADGYAVMCALRACLPRLLVVVLTDLSSCGQILKALEAGAQGVLFRRQPAEELLRALRTVAGGGWYVGPILPAELRLAAALEDQSDAIAAPVSGTRSTWLH